MQKLLVDCVARLHELGLQVKAIVSDQGSNFLKAYQGMGVSVTSPFLTIGDKTMFVFFDPCHLLKSARNVLEKNNVQNGDCNAKWEHIKSLYDLDAKRSYRLAPRLGSQHINLTAFSKMRVRLAAQTLSHSVAAALEMNCAVGTMTSDALVTAEYAKKFDTMFDCFNSSEAYCTKVYRSSFSAKSKHRNYLLNTMSWLFSLRVSSLTTGRDITSQVKCFNGLRNNINALLLLWDDLHSNHGFRFLLTRRLNQDPLEIFFGVIRQAGGFNANPTPYQFRNAYRKACFNSLLQPDRTGNCFPDGDKLLATQSKLSATAPQTSSSKLTVCPLDMSDLPEPSDLCEKNALMYVCWFC